MSFSQFGQHFEEVNDDGGDDDVDDDDDDDIDDDDDGDDDDDDEDDDDDKMMMMMPSRAGCLHAPVCMLKVVYVLSTRQEQLVLYVCYKQQLGLLVSTKRHDYVAQYIYVYTYICFIYIYIYT